MRKFLLATAAVAAAFAAAPAMAVINAPVPTDNYITVGGLDWAWAAPCAAYGPSCGVVDMSYQSTQGWRFPTLAEFLARPDPLDFGGKCAAAWFSTAHSHCDVGDAIDGFIFDYGYGVLPYGSLSTTESWVVRGQSGVVPEPAAWALMIAGFGMVGATLRRRQTATA